MLSRCRQHLIEWNEFPSDDQVYAVNDDDDNPQITTTNSGSRLLQQQRIATRVYAIALLTSLFILVTCTLLSRQTKVVTINNPSLETYEQLQKKYSSFLNCPCSANTMSYSNFISSEIAMHQICSSDFINQEWIDALFIPDASRYGAIDFRATASSQFELLNTLCSLARENIFHGLSDLNNTQLSTASVVPEKEIFIQTKISGERIRTVTVVRLNNALKLIELSTHSNHIISALNTNFIFAIGRLSVSQGFLYWSSYTAWEWTFKNQTTTCLCQYNTCSSPAGFYSLADINNFDVHSSMTPQKYNASYMVPGFVGSCTPLEAVLQATFICLYDLECIEKLADYFPRLARIIPTIQILNASISSKYPQNVNVSRLVEGLFLENWTISTDYDRYYATCAPKICIYSYTKRTDFAYMITMLISLYGGLQSILEFCIPRIVKSFMKQRFDNISNSARTTTTQISIRKRIVQRLVIYFGILKKKFLDWNLFTSIDRSPEAIRHQRLSTRIFLGLLFGSLFILLLFTTISEQTTNATYYRPSYNTYKQLYTKYSDKLICPCSEITPTYGSFVSITPTYHPICSSVFVTQSWFDQLIFVKAKYIDRPQFVMSDWRIMSLGYFQSLAALCKLADSTINHDLQVFRTRTIVTTRLLNEALFHSEINRTLDVLIHSMETEFENVNNILRLLFQVNQYFSGSTYNGQIAISRQFGVQQPKINILFDRPGHIFFKPKCVCAFDPDCEEQMLIVHDYEKIIVPGFVWRCSAMDSILYSTLVCLYSNTNCLQDILLRYMNYTSSVSSVPPLKISQLIRTSRNSTVAKLAENLFVEEWKTSFSYLKYFKTCAPRVCQYTYVKRADHLYVITMFLALCGGLTLILRLLVQLMGKIILRCRHPSNPTNEQQTERIPRTARFHAMYQYISETTKAKIVDCNVFQTYVFSQDINRITRLQLGRITTRLYICLYIVGIIILVLYTTIEQRTIVTKTDHPSLLIAQELHTKYTGTIECPCTRASIPVETFFSIQTSFHQICTSTFVKKEWRESVINNLNNMSYFSSINDYRPFLSAHLQFLSGLCYHAMKHVNDTIRSFTSDSLITSRLLSKISFDKQLSNLLYQMETNIPMTFTRALQLAQTINHGNALMSVHGSNYEYVTRENSDGVYSVLYTLPMTYYGLTNCSCGSQSTCIQPAAFTWPHYQAVEGLLIGCLPSESFLASTLECFFDMDCINLIHNHTLDDKNRMHVDPLNESAAVHSRYQINTTVQDIVATLFMEKWSTEISYDRYFAECAPNICSYSYIDNANPLYVAMTLLGLYGGLTIVLSWLCPRLVLLFRRILIYYNTKRRIYITPGVPSI